MMLCSACGYVGSGLCICERRHRKTMKPTLDALREAKAAEDDPEKAHGMADAALVAFIRQLGYSAVADAFNAIKKWYA